MITTYSADLVTHYILDYYQNVLKTGVNNLALQKLLYFIQLEFIINHKKICFNDEIEAWGFGPVIPNVYHKYDKYGSNIILRSECEYVGNIADEDKNIIYAVIDQYKIFSNAELMSMSMETEPYIRSYKKWTSPNVISIKLIKECYNINK